MGDKQQDKALAPIPADQSEEREAPKVPLKPYKESLYDRVHLSVKQLDIIILILGIILVGALVLGTLVGNGVISGPKF